MTEGLLKGERWSVKASAIATAAAAGENLRKIVGNCRKLLTSKGEIRMCSDTKGSPRFTQKNSTKNVKWKAINESIEKQYVCVEVQTRINDFF